MRHAQNAPNHLHSCIISTLSAAVAATATFCVTRRPIVMAGVAGIQRVDDVVRDLRGEPAEATWRVLTEVAGEGDGHRAYKTHDVLPAWRSLLPESHVLPGHDDILCLWLRQEGVPLGVVGAARRTSDGPFGQEARARLESFGAVFSNMIALQHRCDELQRREVVTRAIPAVTGGYCVIDEERERIIWVTATDTAIRVDDVWAHEDALVAVVARHARSLDEDGPVPSYPNPGFCQIARVVALGEQPMFGSRRCSVIALTAPGAFCALSPRERQIANLLVAGYTTINAAAILSVSENTIRTYVRRLYRKLNVVNRADLARKCASNYGVSAANDDGAPAHSARVFVAPPAPAASGF